MIGRLAVPAHQNTKMAEVLSPLLREWSSVSDEQGKFSETTRHPDIQRRVRPGHATQFKDAISDAE